MRGLVERGIDVHIGDGRFTGRDRVRVGRKTLRFKRAIIATGARPAVPTEIPGLAEAGFLTNLNVFDLPSCRSGCSCWEGVPSVASWRRPSVASGAR